MPREDRRIFFDHDETFKALYSLCSQKGVPKPPPGLMLRVEENFEHPLEMDFWIENPKNSSPELVRYTKDFVVAALMIMCRSIGIPLPKAANKTLEIIKDRVVLRVQMLR